MRKVLGALLMVVACLASARFSCAGENVAGNVDVIVGQKLLMPSDWKSDQTSLDISKPVEWGLMTDIRAKNWPINIAVQYLMSGSDDSGELGSFHTKWEGQTSELALGVRKYFMEDQKFIPYVGGGAASIYAKQKLTITGLETVSASDTKWGPWIDAGVKYKIIPQLNLGFNARYSYAKPELDNGDGTTTKINAGGWHWGVFAGWSF